MRSLLRVVIFCVALAIANAVRTCERDVMQLSCRSVRTCERDVMELSCRSGQVLKIRAAMYGRQNAQYCSGGGVHTTSCGRDVKQTVANICDDRPSCQVEASNSLFSDPCQGTRKYLQVDYSCQNPKDTVVAACEGNSMTLNCPVGTGITITQANYGRHGRYTCNRHNIERLVCVTNNTKQVMTSRCGGKRTCRVEASDSVFGDPCTRTYKYLEVRYHCTR